MYTEITIKETGEKVTHYTQQYDIGTYIIINHNPALQGGSTLKERDYHIKLRKTVLKANDLISSGTILSYKGKLPLNEFKTINTNNNDKIRDSKK